MIKFIIRLIALTGAILNLANTLCCNTTDIRKLSHKEIFIPEKLEPIEVWHNDDGFKVVKNGEIKNIQSYFVEKPIRGISKDNLSRLLSLGARLHLNYMQDDEYSIKLNGSLHGSGPG